MFKKEMLNYSRAPYCGEAWNIIKGMSEIWSQLVFYENSSCIL